MDRGAGQRWEYMALTAVVELHDDRLNERGAEGWELVAALPLHTGQVYYVFKRPATAAPIDGRVALAESASARAPA